MTEPREHRIRVRRSARWYELGSPGPAVREIWLVVHGYGQLAGAFIEWFTPIAGPERLIAAPEALSRFYVSPPGGDHRQAAVGATWMTRADREAEILDYVDYLDAVVARVRGSAPGAERLVALGFSQGTATVSRWAAHGAEAPDRLILWGGGPADDLPATLLRERFGTTPLEVVQGLRDGVVPFAAVERTVERFRGAGVAVDLRSYEGGHRIDPAVLAEVATR